MTRPMFDLEDCEDAVLIDNKTTSNQFIKARNCPRIHLEKNEAGLNELSKLGLPIEALTEEQINEIVSEIINRKGNFSTTDNSWLSNAAVFATLAADIKCTILGVLTATGITCYKTIKEKIKTK
ncbi:hypothetical protein [Photobacterium sp. GB-36]|uniref:hypothetical protein n=1 Tax=Photobacterium sp. GB-36 TaxID=2022108 RepID=UPI000D166015|nr:hypothetical protein [Photobacterium sp. GB-36]PSV43704.1 hypothetical protein C9J46_11055 [Photobacterium sp. GB-36]